MVGTAGLLLALAGCSLPRVSLPISVGSLPISIRSLPITLLAPPPPDSPYRLPKVKSGERIVTIAPGDTVSELAQLYRVDFARLAARNNLSAPFTIYVGQKLVIPAWKDPSRPVPRNRPETRPDPQPARQIAAAPAQSLPKPRIKPTPRAGEAETPAARATTATRRPPAALPDPHQRSGFVWPVQGPIVLGFGPSKGGLYNDGINIGARQGTPVKAAENGVVAYVGNELRGFGNLILINHADGYVTAYAHTDKMLVKRGQRVKRGQNIATVGSTGAVNQPQLHFEIRKGRKARNPLKILPRAVASR